MAKLIDKDKLLAGIDSEIPAALVSEYKAGLFRARLLISEAPLVPAQEVRYGRWEQLTEYEDGRHCRCSECGREFELGVGAVLTNKYNLCPVCGAYMQHGRNRIRLEDFCDILLERLGDLFDTEFAERRRTPAIYRKLILNTVNEVIKEYVPERDAQ